MARVNPFGTTAPKPAQTPAETSSTRPAGGSKPAGTKPKK